MYSESDELLTHFHKLCWNAQDSALKNVHNIEIPICSILTELSSTDCLHLINIKLDNWSNQNQPTLEKILYNYLITDYISCGLSSPTFHTVFQRTLQSNKSKTKLIKDLIVTWDCLFKIYKLTSSNIEFVKCFLVSLSRLFIKISNTVSDNIDIKYLFNKVIDRIKNNIKVFEQSNVSNQILHTLSNNMELHNINKYKQTSFYIDNLVSKKITEAEFNNVIQGPSQQSKQSKENIKGIILKNELQKESLDTIKNHHNYNSECLIDHHLSKKPKLVLNNIHDVQNLSTKLDPNNIMKQYPEQKLNAFQFMMLNAKKFKK